MAAHYEPLGYIVAQYPRTRLITGRRLPAKRLTEQQSATPAVQGGALVMINKPWLSQGITSRCPT